MSFHVYSLTVLAVKMEENVLVPKDNYLFLIRAAHAWREHLCPAAPTGLALPYVKREAKKLHFSYFCSAALRSSAAVVDHKTELRSSPFQLLCQRSQNKCRTVTMCVFLSL